MKVILHICCGICAAGAGKQLIEEGHEVAGYFFNPNIQPAEEYTARLEAAQKVASELGFPIKSGFYSPDLWLRETSALASEKEGGRRCELCYRIRLKATLDYMRETGVDAFTTTLTIGPRKSAEIINKIGREIGGESFIERDFKKKDGFKKANELARRLDIYRQNYCGCIYSKHSL